MLTNSQSESATMLDALEAIYANARRLIESVAPDQRYIQTPCSDWNTHQLVNHMTGTCNTLAAAARREVPQTSPDDDHFGDVDPPAAFTAAAQANLAAWRSAGALDGQISVPVEMPAIAGLGVNILDIGTHCWDLAEAIGADHGLTAEHVALIDYWNRAVINDQIRSGGGFGPPLEPSSDDDLTTMLAFTGRTV